MAQPYVQIKSLQVQKNNLENSIKANQSEINRIAATNVKLHHELAIVNKQIADIQKGNQEPAITEHALVRYFERVLGYDLDVVKQWLLPEKTLGLVKELGNGNYKTASHTVVVKNNTVVTILKPDQTPSR